MTAITPAFDRQSRLDFHRRNRDKALASHPGERAKIEAYYQQKLAGEGLTEDELAAPSRETPAATPDGPGRVGGTLRSAAQGLTFGFSDELRGLGAALMPGGDTYASARDKERTALKDFKVSNPYLANTAEIAGGVAGTFLTGGMGRAAQGVGAIEKALKTRRALAGAKEALPYAAAYSFGAAEGDATDQAIQTALGTAVGTAAGAAAPWAIGKVVAGGRGLLNAGRRTLGRPVAAQQEGAERVLSQLVRDGLTPDEAAARVVSAGDAGVGDVALADLGPNLRGDLDWAANVPGAGQRTIAQWAKQRDASMRRIMKEAYQTIVERRPKSAALEGQALKDLRARSGYELFEPLWASVGDDAITDPALFREVSDALNVDRSVFARAAKVARSRKHPIYAETVTPDGEVTKAPTLRFAHYVKTTLQEMADQEAATGNASLAGGLTERGTALRGALVDALGEPYEQALANHAALSTQIDALELGAKMLQDNIDAGLLAQQFLGMDDAAQQAFLTGADAALRKKLGRGAMGKRLSNAWWTDDAVQSKLRLIMRNDELQRFTRLMDASADKQLTHNLVGSQTFGRVARDTDATAGAGQALRTILTNPAGSLRAAGTSVAKEVERRERERVAAELPQWLTAQGPDLLRRLTDLDVLAQGLIGQQATRRQLSRQAGTYFGGSR